MPHANHLRRPTRHAADRFACGARRLMPTLGAFRNDTMQSKQSMSHNLEMQLPEQRLASWAKLVAISTVGWLIACPMSVVIASVVTLSIFAPTGQETGAVVGEGGFGLAWITITATVCGALGGAVQQFLLRSKLTRSNHWTLATTAGCAIGALVGSLFIVGVDMDVEIGFVGLFSLVGLACGTAQWLLIRAEFPDRWWWMLVTTLAGCASSVAAIFAFLFVSESLHFEQTSPIAEDGYLLNMYAGVITSVVVAGILLGLINGLGLLLLAKPISGKSSGRA
jgi:hypothetical protein